MSSLSIEGRNPATGRALRVTVADGVVQDIQNGPPTTKWLAPGLIDLQVNGFGEYDVNAALSSVEDITAMARKLFGCGVTTIVPTVITAEEAQIVAALRRVYEARKADPLLSYAIPYVHVEGPHLSDEDGPRGVHPIEHIRPPSIEEFDRWQEACDGLVGMVTISPHWAATSPYVESLAGKGVRVAIGHTHASSEDIRAAVDAGATLSTHLGNGAHSFVRRHPNYLWAQLAEDRLAAGFIADGHHLPDDTLIAMLRAKSLDRAFLVSDATSLAGMEPGRYRTPVGGEVELSEDGRLSQLGTPYLAGAARPITDGVAHVAGLGPFTLADAVRLATASPGRFCGNRGVIGVGSSADLVTFDWEDGDSGLTIDRVIVAGTEIPMS